MSQQGDYGNEGSEPWANRRLAIPRRTWTGKVVYPHPPSRRHFWTIRDAERILDRLVPPDAEDPTSWADLVIETLRNATLKMMGKILFFLDKRTIEKIYEWCIAMLDRVFGQEETESDAKAAARRIIVYLADRTGLTVTIK